MIRRYIGDSEHLLSVIGVEAGALLTAGAPEDLADTLAWAGITWCAVATQAQAQALRALLTGSRWDPQLVVPCDADCNEAGQVCVGPNAPLRRRVYHLFDGSWREEGGLDALHAAGCGGLAQDPLCGLAAPARGVSRVQWQLFRTLLDRQAAAEDCAPEALVIGVLQATPGLIACQLSLTTSEQAAAAADWGAPAKSKTIKRLLRWAALAQQGALPPDDNETTSEPGPG